MFLPPVFQETDPSLIEEAVASYSFATLTSTSPEGLLIDHVPTLLERRPSEPFSVLFHVAARNPQSQSLSGPNECGLIFVGPHTYVSPGWYSQPPNVPTWNYMAVHLFGRPDRLSREELLDFLGRLSDTHEAKVQGRWAISELPADLLDHLLEQIVGFRLVPTRVEAKAKLSQNRTPEDQQRVAQHLTESADPRAVEVGEWMQKLQRLKPPM